MAGEGKPQSSDERSVLRWGGIAGILSGLSSSSSPSYYLASCPPHPRTLRDWSQGSPRSERLSRWAISSTLCPTPSSSRSSLGCIGPCEPRVLHPRSSGPYWASWVLETFYL